MFGKNDIVDLTITDITDEGNGVGKVDGFTVFVPLTAIGDKIHCRLVKVQKQFAYGIVDQLLEPSNQRVEPGCPVYRTCGGCSLRHISYEAELEIKQNWVKQHLQRIGGMQPPLLPILASPLQEAYRNKAQYPVRCINGEIQLGMFGKRSHRVVPCMDCRLQPPEFEPVLQAIQQFVREHHISVYDEEKHVGLLRHVYLRHAQATGEIMLCLVINGEELPHAKALAGLIAQACPTVCSIYINQNTARTNVILGERCKLLWGKERITDLLCGLKIELSPLSFYQVNREGAQLLYTVAARFAQLTGGELLLDLYCGTGTIGLSMASQARELIGVEVVAAAIQDARRNAQNNGILNARFLCSDASGAAVRLKEEGLRPDVVVLDPPRKGCSPEALRAVAEMAPSRLVMISCNSATLARDLALLHTLNYRTVKVQPVDLFPRTAHVETVCLLTRMK